MLPTGQETGAPAMNRSPAAKGRRANAVVERKLDELCDSLHSALSFTGPRSPDAERRLVEDIKNRTDFLRYLLVAEGGGERPVHLAEAEARFAVLKATFDKWARSVVGAPAADEEDEMEGEPEEEDGCSGSSCSCTDSCQEAAAGDADREAMEGRKDVASFQEASAAGDAECDVDREAVEAIKDVTSDATGKKRDAERESVVMKVEVAPDAVAQKRDDVVTGEEKTTDATAKMRQDVVTRDEVPSDAGAKKREAAAEAKKRRTVQRRWWSRSAAWCGAAGVVAVVAVGLAVELAAVAHNNVNVYVVPT